MRTIQTKVSRKLVDWQQALPMEQKIGPLLSGKLAEFDCETDFGRTEPNPTEASGRAIREPLQLGQQQLKCQ